MTNGFTFVFDEHDLCMLIEATEVAVEKHYDECHFTREQFAEMCARLNQRLDY